MKKLDEKGQVTVFLALLFLVMSMAILALMDGMRCNLGKGLTQEALEGAGKVVTANYQKNLADRYHLFFLDSEEKPYINQDGKEYLEDYLGNFAFRCQELNLEQVEGVLDQQGEALRKQIVAYMKYKKAGEAGQELMKLMGYCQKTEEKQEEALAEVQQISDASDQENIEAEEHAGEKEPLEAAKWKEIKELLESIMQSGILLYVCDDRAISNLQADLSQLPSRHLESRNVSLPGETEFKISLENLQEVKNVLQENPITLDTMPDMYLLYEYWDSSFRDWQDTQWDCPNALHYEKEFMIAGHEKDHDNLKAVANRMMTMRFAVNFAYACQDAGLSAQAELMGLSLAGVLGLPQLTETVKYILLAALSYSESLLDVHALFAGHKVPAIKDSISWMTNFENVVELLRNKTVVKEGVTNLAYQEYLKIFIGNSAILNKLHLKMADVMQLNISLEKPGFMMEDCVSSYTWQASFHCPLWNTGLLPRESIMTLEKQISYN